MNALKNTVESTCLWHSINKLHKLYKGTVGFIAGLLSWIALDCTGGPNKLRAPCTLICFNFYRDRSTPLHISITPLPAVPCGLKTLLGASHAAFAYGQACIFIGWCHACVTAKEKFDASRNTVRELSCDDEVIHTLGWDAYFSLTYHLAPQVVQHPVSEPEPPRPPNPPHTLTHTHVPNSHILSCQAATQHWQLFGVCL